MASATEALPTGIAALHPDWPEARFNLSGMFTHHPLIIELINIMEQAFDCRLPIESVHGAPGVLWNAGRPSKARFDPAAMRAALDVFYARKIGYYPTFTNHLLESNDLKDRTCNYILDCIAERPDLNGVIVTSDLLSAYIAEKYPALRQVASIVKVTFDRGKGRVDYYRALGQRFSRYVLHPDDCRDLELLAQLDRDKAEIIVNENCAIHCPNRARHYDVYARWQKLACAPPAPITLNSISPMVEEQFVFEEVRQMDASCQAPVDLASVLKGKRGCNLTFPELKAIYDMGFRHFKLQGRADVIEYYAYDLTRFLLDPTFVAPMVVKALLRSICTGAVPS